MASVWLHLDVVFMTSTFSGVWLVASGGLSLEQGDTSLSLLLGDLFLIFACFDIAFLAETSKLSLSSLLVTLAQMC